MAVAASVAPAAVSRQTQGFDAHTGHIMRRRRLQADSPHDLDRSCQLTLLAHDHVGVIARTIANCRTLLLALRRSGHHSCRGAAKATPRVPPRASARSVQAAVDGLRDRGLELGARVHAADRAWTALAAHTSAAVQHPELAACHQTTFGPRGEDGGSYVRAGLTIGRGVPAVDFKVAGLVDEILYCLEPDS